MIAASRVEGPLDGRIRSHKQPGNLAMSADHDDESRRPDWCKVALARAGRRALAGRAQRGPESAQRPLVAGGGEQIWRSGRGQESKRRICWHIQQYNCVSSIVICNQSSSSSPSSLVVVGRRALVWRSRAQARRALGPFRELPTSSSSLSLIQLNWLPWLWLSALLLHWRCLI